MGCALARELGKRFDKVLLIDKEKSVGYHTSGRNSGVIHSGFNPKPGTLKARLCVEGSKEVRQYCREREIPFEQVGTYVVAVEEAQLPVLHELKSRGEKNGVPGIEILSMDQVRKHEPNVRGIAALFSPTGAIVDPQALTRALVQDAERRGVAVMLGQEVMRIEEKKDSVQMFTKSDVYVAQWVINCAGLHADRLAHMLGVGKQYVTMPFRGEYFMVRRPGPPIIHSMVYPVPNLSLPFLGIHLTRMVDGCVLIGPNAVPAFGREAYKSTAFNMRDLVQMACHKGVWNALLHNRVLRAVAWNELRRSCSKRYFLQEASRLVVGLGYKDLMLAKRVGIRPQLISSEGQFLEDLVIETTRRSIHILNVMSPGVTSALAFARWLMEGIDNGLHGRCQTTETVAC